MWAKLLSFAQFIAASSGWSAHGGSGFGTTSAMKVPRSTSASRFDSMIVAIAATHAANSAIHQEFKRSIQRCRTKNASPAAADWKRIWKNVNSHFFTFRFVRDPNKLAPHSRRCQRPLAASGQQRKYTVWSGLPRSVGGGVDRESWIQPINDRNIPLDISQVSALQGSTSQLNWGQTATTLHTGWNVNATSEPKLEARGALARTTPIVSGAAGDVMVLTSRVQSSSRATVATLPQGTRMPLFAGSWLTAIVRLLPATGVGMKGQARCRSSR